MESAQFYRSIDGAPLCASCAYADVPWRGAVADVQAGDRCGRGLLTMGCQLALDHIGAESRLVQDRRRDIAEAVAGHLALVAEPIAREQHRVVADRLVRAAA